MSEPMKPALTAEEWKEALKFAASTSDGAWGITTNWDGERWYASPEDRHAAAAYALYGQPFGFTREDVTELRRAADRIDNEWGVEIGDVPQAVALRLIADRVEALLPSETGWTLVKGAEHVSGSAGGSFSATSDEPKPALPPTEDQSK